MNKLIQGILRSTIIYYIAQIILTTLYWQSGVTKLLNFSHTESLMVGWGLTPAWFFSSITIFVQIVASLVIIFGKRWAWLGAGALAVFTLATMFTVQEFWHATTLVSYTAEKGEFIDHITLIGGLMMSAIAAEHKYGNVNQ